MGLFSFSKKREAVSLSAEEKILLGADNSEVLIPDHAKEKSMEEEATKVFLVNKERKEKVPNKLKVLSVYDVGDEVLVSGIVESGKIKKKMKLVFKEKNSVVSDLKIGSNSVAELLLNEEGTVFIKGKNLHLVRRNDVLEFK